jgi:hypothetical protein
MKTESEQPAMRPALGYDRGLGFAAAGMLRIGIGA